MVAYPSLWLSGLVVPPINPLLIGPARSQRHGFSAHGFPRVSSALFDGCNAMSRSQVQTILEGKLSR
jgi:hypothetical protein